MADGVDDYSSCLLFASSSNCIVDNCQIISNGSTNGIWFDTSDSITVNNCTITVLSNNLARGQDNIHTDYGNGGHTFTNNKFYNYGYNSYPHNDLIQFTYPGGASNLQTVIANNFFYYSPTFSTGVGAACVFVSQSYGDRYLIYNNIFIDTKISNYSGITLWRYDDTKHLSARIYNNTFIDGTTSPTPIGTMSGIDTIIIKNNIFVADSTTGATDLLWFNRKLENTPYKDIDYNHYYQTGGSTYIAVDSTTGTTWTAWKGYSNTPGGYIDAHSDTGMVNFVNNTATIASGYALNAGSKGINQGTDLTGIIPALDIIGTLRPQGAGWDMGAFEYIQPIPPIGSVGSVIIQLGKKGLQSFRINSR